MVRPELYCLLLIIFLTNSVHGSSIPSLLPLSPLLHFSFSATIFSTFTYNTISLLAPSLPPSLSPSLLPSISLPLSLSPSSIPPSLPPFLSLFPSSFPPSLPSSEEKIMGGSYSSQTTRFDWLSEGSNKRGTFW